MTKMLLKIAQDSDQIDSLLQTGDRLWMVNFSERVNIDIDLAPTVNKVFFTVPLGVPKQSDRARILDALMIYTAAWETTEGICMGQAGPGGDIIMRADVVLGDASEDSLNNVLHNFAAKAELWADFVTTGSFPGSNDPRETTIATLGKYLDDADKASGDKTGKVRDVFAGVSKSLGHDTGGAISAIKLSTLTFAAQGGTQTLVAPETRDNSAPTGPGMDSMNG